MTKVHKAWDLAHSHFFLVQFHYFPPSQSQFWSKNEYLCSCYGKENVRVVVHYLYGCHFKVRVRSWARFTKLETWLISSFQVQSRNFPPSQHLCWRKVSICVIVTAKITCVYGCILHRRQYKVSISWLKFMKLGTWLITMFIVQSCHFLPSQPWCWSTNEYMCGCYGQQYMCVWLYSIWMLLYSKY